MKPVEHIVYVSTSDEFNCVVFTLDNSERVTSYVGFTADGCFADTDPASRVTITGPHGLRDWDGHTPATLLTTLAQGFVAWRQQSSAQCVSFAEVWHVGICR